MRYVFQFESFKVYVARRNEPTAKDLKAHSRKNDGAQSHRERAS